MRREHIVGTWLGVLLTWGCGPLGGQGSASQARPGASTPGGQGGGSAQEMPGPSPTMREPVDGEFATLRQAGEATGHLVGIAMSARQLNNATYIATARDEFNYVTPENEMKWNSLQPNPGQFNFGNAERIVSFAEQNNMKVKGHTLVWHSQLPMWVQALATPEEVRATMLNHINTVVTHFKGRVFAWDVVNEAWQNGTSLRNSVFMTQLGAGFIDEAFIAARAADPDAKLYYNDFGGEGTGGKGNAIFNMVQSMVSRGIPIDGVGMQMHTRTGANPSPTTGSFAANMQRLRELGLEVVVSEMDVATCGDSPMEVRMDGQRSRYYDLVSACVDEVACSAVTIWGINDGSSWLNNQAASLGCTGGQTPLGLLFDDSYQRKPAYSGVMDALLGR